MSSFLKSFRYAFEGVAHAIRTQRNMKVHLACALLAILAAVVLGFEAWRWAVLILIIGAVLSAELFNTALESIVDLASPEYHSLAKIAKDCAAGAVLIQALAAVLLAVVLYLPKIMALLGAF